MNSPFDCIILSASSWRNVFFPPANIHNLFCSLSIVDSIFDSDSRDKISSARLLELHPAGKASDIVPISHSEFTEYSIVVK